MVRLDLSFVDGRNYQRVGLAEPAPTGRGRVPPAGATIPSSPGDPADETRIVMPEAPGFVDDHLLRIGTYDFHCEHPIRQVPPGRLPVEKVRGLVEDYIDMCRALQPTRIVELGVYKGGSTALLSELVGPEKLVSIEFTPTPVELLDGYIEERGLGDVVRPFYGVDQSDRVRVAEIVRAEFGGRPIDLVIDDASHLYEESRSSFETLFPHVRPGGLFLLEDWCWQHQVADAATRPNLSEQARQAIAKRMESVAAGEATATVPMSRLVLELILARASSGEAVADVTIGSYWAAVRRGPGHLDPDTFRVTDLFEDHFGLLDPAR